MVQVHVHTYRVCSLRGVHSACVYGCGFECLYVCLLLGVSVTSEELGDGTDDLEYADDAADGELLLIEGGGVDRYVTEMLWCGAATEYLDGAYGVEYDGVDLAVLYVADGALTECYDVAVVDLGLHGVPRDVAPCCGLLEAGHLDVVCGYGGLAVDDEVEAAKEVYIVVWYAIGGVGQCGCCGCGVCMEDGHAGGGCRLGQQHLTVPCE